MPHVPVDVLLSHDDRSHHSPGWIFLEWEERAADMKWYAHDYKDRIYSADR